MAPKSKPEAMLSKIAISDFKKLPGNLRREITILAYAIIILFLIQTTATLVESIYILDLLKTSLDEKALGVLFFFSPFLLFFFRKRAPTWAFWLAFASLFLARGATPYLDTLGRMLASGIGTSAALILLPILLVDSPNPKPDPRGFWKPLGSREDLAPAQGLALGIGLSVLVRTVNYTLDISLTPTFGWIGWLLGAVLGLALIPLQRRKIAADRVSSAEPTEFNRAEISLDSAVDSARVNAPVPDREEDQRASASIRVPYKNRITLPSLGLLAVITLVYFAFSSPGVIARWTEGNYMLIVSAVSLFALGWLFVSFVEPAWAVIIKPATLFLWNLTFSFFLLATILINTVSFPFSPSSPPEVIGSPLWYEAIPLWLMLVLSPVIFVDFACFSKTIINARPSLRQLAPGFLLGSGLLVVLVFMNIFSNVWGYVEPVSGFFRGKFWLPFLLAGGLIPVLARQDPKGFWKPLGSAEDNLGTRSNAVAMDRVRPVVKLAWGVALGSIFLVTFLAAAFTGRPYPTPPPQESLRAMTYNIQEANDVFGEKSYDRQLDLIRQVDPDVLGLQESDSARISLGNNDYTRYYAGKLGYYSYYGPKTVNGTFGTALLSKYPLEFTRTIYTYSDRDEVGTTAAVIQVGDFRVAVVNVHPAGSAEVMLAFAGTLLEQASFYENVIALGDYNLRESDPAYQLIAAEYQNAWLAVFPTGNHTDPIDHIFLSPHLDVLDAVYLLPPESATDHPAHWADIGW